MGLAYRVVYEIEGSETTIEWSWGEIDGAALRNRPKNRGLRINERKRKTEREAEILTRIPGQS
ncbi:hypothetical protein NONS58_28410 [Nitrosococcus oceani]|nr:hypothetical protein NONS58_28410 [Nitrosococcus oceani]